MTKQPHKRPRIAYFTINDPTDKRSWSGITYYMAKSMSKNIGDVEFLGPVKIPFVLDKVLRAIQKISRALSQTEYIPKYSFLKNGYAAWRLKRKLKKGNFDFVYGPAAASELGCLNTQLPVVYFGDATFKIYSSMYKKEFNKVNPITRWEGNCLEQRALDRASLVIFSSSWASDSAISDYAISKKKLEVIEFGANIDRVPPVQLIFEKENNDVITLIFVSVDWDRKGGPIAFETLKALHRAGKKTTLIICGCQPPPEFQDEDMLVVPFLNKNIAADALQLEKLFLRAHFLLLPTRADCTPLVNFEANAFGVPAITTDVGGVAYGVKDGVNGYCLPLAAEAPQYAALIAEIFSNKERYHQLVVSSRKRFDEQLNWDSFSSHLKKQLEKHEIFSFQ